MVQCGWTLANTVDELEQGTTSSPKLLRLVIATEEFRKAAHELHCRFCHFRDAQEQVPLGNIVPAKEALARYEATRAGVFDAIDRADLESEYTSLLKDALAPVFLLGTSVYATLQHAWVLTDSGSGAAQAYAGEYRSAVDWFRACCELALRSLEAFAWRATVGKRTQGSD